MTSPVAVVLVSHGTVDDLDDLGGFVTNVRRGRPAPPELIAELRHRYQAIGGSPLNRINLTLAEKLAEKLGVAVVAANRLWHPYVREVVPPLEEAGVRRIVLLPLAQHSVHVYAEDGRRAVEGRDVELVCVPAWGDRADLHEAFARRIVATLGDDPAPTTLVLSAHSLPVAVIKGGDPYERDFRAAAAAVAALVRGQAGAALDVRVCFQSQGMAGGPGEWLGPDLEATLDAARDHGSKRVVLAPVGFLADHVEILYDLDVEARAMAMDRGMAFARAPSLNADDDLVDVLDAVAGPFLDVEG
ncbi:MAG TPA: ferrochelatase [Polyangiaceae bacterium]|jgi:ferrochelatase|nr:ferrochelatase [Polyangiaceae bacterium]